MKIKLLNSFIAKKRIHQSIDSKEIFQALLELERERSDRNGNPFSVLTLSIKKNHTDEDLIKLISALKNRIRNIDELGWLDNDIIGVILPDTPVEGALGLAEDIKDQMSPSDNFIDFQVEIYPDTENPPIDCGEEPKKESLENKSEKKSENKSNEHRVLTGRPIPPWKRSLDIIGATLALILLSPLLVCTAILIKSVSRGPVFFRQERVGYKGRPFMIFKFRTMHSNTDPEKHKEHVRQLIQSGKQWNKLDDRPDAGIIPFGNILRKTAIDELPQLINVLRGEMSLIGPRPCIVYEACEFDRWQYQRFDTLPGLTGLWQVSGKNSTTFEEMLRLDISYGRKRSLLRDIVIFFKTFPVLIKQSITNEKGKGKADE